MGQAFSGPKCTLDVVGNPLIRRTVKMLQAQNIEVAVVVGYKKETIFRALEGFDVHYYFNPFYKVTNSMASLWFARDYIDCKDDIILGNADVFWDDDVLNLLLADQRDAVMLVDTSRVDVGDYFFKIENGLVTAYGKELTKSERNCEYVGLAKLKADFLPGFKARINQCVEEEVYDLWWENVLYNHLKEHPVYALDVEGRFWGEIDYIEDYARILNHIHMMKN